MQELYRIEYKRELNDRFERAVVSFLNYSGGGEILIGVDDDGTGLFHPCRKFSATNVRAND